MNNIAEQDIQQLNSFLRGELSAVETYQQCIEKMRDVTVVSELGALQESHRRRVALLSERVRRLGGEPANDSGVWGGLAKLAEGTAKVFGTSAAVSVLEEGEDHGRDDYERDVHKLSPSERRFIELEILPEQQRTHDALSRIESVV